MSETSVPFFSGPDLPEIIVVHNRGSEVRNCLFVELKFLTICYEVRLLFHVVLV
jgi:hypothetical protein